MRSRLSLTALAFAGVLALGGCVQSDLERAALGGVAGGATAAVFGGNVATGAAIGAAGGAVCDDVNLC